MDKNQVTGLVLIGVLLLAYMTFFAPEQTPPQKATTEQTADKSTIDTKDKNVAVDSANQAPTGTIEEKVITLENEDLKVELSNIGGTIKSARLKQYTNYFNQNITLVDEESKISHVIKTKANTEYDLSNAAFAITNESENDSAFVISMAHSPEAGSKITYTYVFPKQGFEVFFSTKVEGAKFQDGSMRLFWSNLLKRHEQGLSESKQKSWINYYSKDEGLDDVSSDESNIEYAIDWFSFKQRFFNAGLISLGDQFTSPTLSSTEVNNDIDTSHIKLCVASVNIPLNGDSKYYFGPNDFDICADVAEGYKKNVYLGWGPFGVVNRFLILPLFRVLDNMFSNYGIIILIMVIIIKILLFPIAFKSYLSMAKMKVLKPQIDAIKEKAGGDMAAVQQEQMKLYRQVGVNPLSGCIPVVLQMPILLALFNYFPNSIELRHESFLWAHDLSTYDAPITWSADIPLISWLLGNHLSVFTLLMTVSQIAYTYYNNQINTTATGPMKNIGYIMPVIFMFVLNNFSAGLTWYYFVSNMFTIAQQLVATRFINKDKIKATMDANRQKFESSGGTSGKKKSKFQARLEEAMKAQQEKKKGKN